MNAHPEALAFLGVGDADSYNLGRLKEQKKGTYLTAGFDVDPKTLEYIKKGTNFAGIDPEHYLKGYIATAILIKSVRESDGKLPDGWFKTPGLVMNSSNIDEILKRQQSVQNAYQWSAAARQAAGEPGHEHPPPEGSPLTCSSRRTSSSTTAASPRSTGRHHLGGGEVHALVGENGANKSTLVKILSGVVRPEGGTVELDGAPVRFTDARQAAGQGVAIVSQELMTYDDLTVLENLFPYGAPRRRGLVSTREMRRLARPVLDELGLDPPPHAKVGGLPLADRQLLEICRALLQNPAS